MDNYTKMYLAAIRSADNKMAATKMIISHANKISSESRKLMILEELLGELETEEESCRTHFKVAITSDGCDEKIMYSLDNSSHIDLIREAIEIIKHKENNE